jgi:hypothetical protein
MANTLINIHEDSSPRGRSLRAFREAIDNLDDLKQAMKNAGCALSADQVDAMVGALANGANQDDDASASGDPEVDEDVQDDMLTCPHCAGKFLPADIGLDNDGDEEDDEEDDDADSVALSQLSNPAMEALRAGVLPSRVLNVHRESRQERLRETGRKLIKI